MIREGGIKAVVAVACEAEKDGHDASMRQLKMSRVFTLIEPGPVVLVTTCDGNKNNVMTISWTMVLDFTPMFAITTGAWNYSFAALQRTRECVIAIPTVDLLDVVVGIGTCSGADTDKFAKFKLTAVPGKLVKAPLIKECLANIECKVVDLIEKHNIVVLRRLRPMKIPRVRRNARFTRSETGLSSSTAAGSTEGR